ncbi:MAG: aldolase [Hyphomicrobiales bacterium]|nr:aldolase [Hyphomicrobiales bacterium]
MSAIACWTSLHATAVVVGEQGLIVRGPSGAGKSALALAMLSLARERALFAALIGDDRVFLRASAERLLLRGAPGFEGLIERRFEGVVAVDHEASAVARLVVDLTGEDAAPPARMPEENERFTELLGVRLPRLTLAPSQGPLDRADTMLHILARFR